jgi:hypothetical protein
MSDIRTPWLLYAKAGLLLFAGLIAALLLLIENPSVTNVALLAISIWAFCRSYYFAFYVIEHYIDPGYKYAGLLAFLRCVLKRRPHPSEAPQKLEELTQSGTEAGASERS